MTNRRYYFIIFCASALLAIAASPHTILPVFHGRLVDTDSYMRLLRIEQGLRRGHLSNLVYRDDSGKPLIIEWSRLVDAFILALSAPLAPFLGWHRALYIGGVATQPLFAGALGASLAFAVAPLADRQFLWAAPVVALLLPGIRGFEAFGEVHYHIILLASIAFTLGWCLRARDGAVRPMLYAGISGGFAIWIMPETMPFIMLGYGTLGLVWLSRPIGAGLARCGAGFFVTTTLATLIDPPHGGPLIAETDRISIIYVALAAATAVSLGWFALLDRQNLHPRPRTTLGMIGAALCLAIWLALFPRVALGPFGLIPARDMKLFFGHMSEVQPVTGYVHVSLVLAPGMIAALYAIFCAWRARTHLPSCAAWFMLSLAIILSVALTARFLIFQQIPAGFAAASVPIMLTDVTRQFGVHPIRVAALRVGIFALFILGTYMPGVVHALAHPKPSSTHGAQCSTVGIEGLLAPAAGKIVLTSVDYVPQLLYRTHILTVGSLYQHGIGAYLRARTAWRTPVGSAPSAAFLRTGAQFVLFCNTSALDYLGKPIANDALWPRLAQKRPPVWLRQIGRTTEQGFRLYAVIAPIKAN
ncbi:MAG: hypothetical protein B7X48_01185 [Acidiphilium sp. 34-60-192]|nr:MAG: hypothetical protein B7X48_01185 [Acidiphilium sp. 34-60-192]